MRSAYPSDPEFGKIYACLAKPEDELSETEKSVCRNYSMSDGLVFYTDKRRNQFRLCVPRIEGNGLRLTIMYEAHDSVLHGGREKTYDMVPSLVPCPARSAEEDAPPRAAPAATVPRWCPGAPRHSTDSHPGSPC